MKRVTLKDVAKELGVAFSTVSMAISDDKTISKKMKDRVAKKIKEMGYYPNRSARNLVKGQTNNIAVVTPGLFSLYEMYIIRGMEEQMLGSMYDLVLYTAKYDWQEVHKELRKILYEHTADAVMVLGVILTDEIIEEFKKVKMPLVLIDGGLNKTAYTLNIDNYECGRLAAAQFLASKRKKPALLLGNTKFAFSQAERLKGFTETLKQSGAAPGNELIIESPEYLPDKLRETGFKGAEILINRGADAIYCSSGDYVAQGVFKYCAQKNIKLPGDVSLIGTDNFDVADALNLTTIEQPLKEMGRSAFEISVNAAKERETGVKSLFFKPKLIIRNT